MVYGSDELSNKKDERLSEFDERVKVIVVMEDDCDIREDMLWALSKFVFFLPLYLSFILGISPIFLFLIFTVISNIITDIISQIHGCLVIQKLFFFVF